MSARDVGGGEWSTEARCWATNLTEHTHALFLRTSKRMEQQELRRRDPLEVRLHQDK